MITSYMSAIKEAKITVLIISIVITIIALALGHVQNTYMIKIMTIIFTKMHCFVPPVLPWDQQDQSIPWDWILQSNNVGPTPMLPAFLIVDLISCQHKIVNGSQETFSSSSKFLDTMLFDDSSSTCSAMENHDSDPDTRVLSNGDIHEKFCPKDKNSLACALPPYDWSLSLRWKKLTTTNLKVYHCGQFLRSGLIFARKTNSIKGSCSYEQEL